MAEKKGPETPVKPAKNKKPKKDRTEKKGGFGKIIGIFLGALIIMAIVFILLIKFDIASLGTKVVGPLIKDIPGATLILPEMPIEEIIDENTTDPTQNYETLEQAVEILKVTENLLKEKEKEAEKLIEQINQLQTENQRLKLFEDNYIAFQEDKAAFDALIAENTDSTTFIEWYETMNPDNAAKIYGEVIIEQKKSQELDDLVLTYQSMKANNAAVILEGMSKTRLEMVATIISHLDAEQAGKVLGAMDPEIASRITAYLYPEN
jgi:flagellar motility protein MotE (MotC chaperone)